MYLRAICLLTLSLLLSTTHSTTTQSSLLVLDLISTNSADFASELTDWTKTSSTSPYYYTCNSALVMGGYSIGGTFSKTYTYLAVHNVIYFSMLIYPIDDWVVEDFLTITIGSLSFKLSGIGRSGLTSPFPSNLCGSATYNDMPPIYARGRVVHSGNQIDLKFQGALTYASNRESFGIREISLRLATEDSPEESYGCFVPTGGYTSENMCACTSSISQYFSDSCKSCSPQCQSCMNTAGFCISCIANYYFDGSTCKACQSPCLKCDSSTKCTECVAGYYLRSDGTCSTTCNSPMTSVTTPIWKCVTSCAAGQYLYWDGTCETVCPYPYIVDYVGKDPLCTNGCSVLLFLYPDATCQASCVGTINALKGFNLCNYPCLSPNFIYGNGSCLTTCNSPYTSTTYGSIKFCGAPLATPYTLPNNTLADVCTHVSEGSFGSGAPVCVNPHAGSYILQNGSTVSSCGAAFTKVSVGLIDYCNLKCPYGEYYFTANDTCSTTCNTPFVVVTRGIETYCQSPCAATEFIATNGKCSTTCPSPLVKSTSTNYSLCFSSSTSPSLFELQNNTLVSTCPSPWVYDKSLPYKVCDIPCETKTDYLTPLLKCLKTCKGPYVPKEDGYYKFCDTPCNSESAPYYKADTGICVASCEPPYVIDPDAFVLQCYLPSYVQSLSAVLAEANKYVSSSLPLFGTAISAISNGGAGVMAFGIMALSRQLFYTRFLKIDFNQDFQDYIVKTNFTIEPSFGFSLPHSWLNLPPYVPLPDRIEGWGLSSKFIYNYWVNLTTILISLGLLIFISGMHIYAKREGLSKEWTFLLRKLSAMFRWNFFLTIFCSSYDSLIIYIVLEFKHFSFETVTGIVSFILAIIAFILMFWFLFLSYVLILECNQRVLKTQFTKKVDVIEDGRRFHLNWQGFLVLFQGYDNENASIFAQAYIFCFLSRSIIWGLIFILLNEYPLVQVICLLVVNITFFLALVFKKPFNSQVSEVVIPLLELLVVIVDILLLVSVIADIFPDVSVSKFRVGILLRYIFDGYNGACFLIVILYLVLGLKNTRKFYLLTLQERKATVPTILASPFVGYIINSSQLEGPDNLEVGNKGYQLEESKVVKLMNAQDDRNNITLSNIPENKNDETGLISDMPEVKKPEGRFERPEKERTRTFASQERLKLLMGESPSPTKRKNSELDETSPGSRIMSVHDDRITDRTERKEAPKTKYELKPSIPTEEKNLTKPPINNTMNNTQTSVMSKFKNMMGLPSNPISGNSQPSQNTANISNTETGNPIRSLARINSRVEKKAPTNIWDRPFQFNLPTIDDKAESEMASSNVNLLIKKPEPVPGRNSPVQNSPERKGSDDRASQDPENISPARNSKRSNFGNLMNSDEQRLKEESPPPKSKFNKNEFNDPFQVETPMKKGPAAFNAGHSGDGESVYSKTEAHEHFSPNKKPKGSANYTQIDEEKSQGKKSGFNGY